MRTDGLPIEFYVLFEIQDTAGGIVECAGRRARSVLEREAGQTIGVRLSGAGVKADAGGFDGDRGTLRRAVFRQRQRDLRLSFGIEAVFVFEESGGGAFYEVVRIA